MAAGRGEGVVIGLEMETKWRLGWRESSIVLGLAVIFTAMRSSLLPIILDKINYVIRVSRNVYHDRL